MKKLRGDVARSTPASGPAVHARLFARLILAGLLLGAAPVAAQDPATGKIEGVATLSRRLTTSRMRVRVYQEPGASVPVKPTDNYSLASVVMYLEAAPALRGHAPPRANAPLVMRQRGERFAPHVLPVLVGSVVDFPNDDGIYHNVFSLSHAREFDLGRYPKGESKQVQFPKAGVVQVFCHIHSDMAGYVLVLDNAFHVVPDSTGRFTLEGVPPGDYNLVAWHERIRPMILPVHVDAGRTTSLTLHIPLPDTLQAR